jgi:hypothetical protein
MPVRDAQMCKTDVTSIQCRNPYHALEMEESIDSFCPALAGYDTMSTSLDASVSAAGLAHPAVMQKSYTPLILEMSARHKIT